MKKNVYLFLCAVLCIAHGSTIHAGLFKSPLKSRIPTSKSIKPTASAFPSTTPPRERGALPRPIRSETGPACSTAIDACLYHALQHKELNRAITCIEEGANPDIKDDRGNTWLHLLAAERKHIAEHIKDIRSLYERGYAINPCIANKEGKTPLEIAATKDNHVLKRLLKHTPLDKKSIALVERILYDQDLELSKVAILYLNNHKEIVAQYISNHASSSSSSRKTEKASPYLPISDFEKRIKEEEEETSSDISSLVSDIDEEDLVSDLEEEDSSLIEEEGDYVDIKEFERRMQRTKR